MPPRILCLNSLYELQCAGKLPTLAVLIQEATRVSQKMYSHTKIGKLK